MRVAPLLPLACAALACGERPAAVLYEAVAVERRDIVVSARAAGLIEPDLTVDVRSKAGGEILDIPVETGHVVEREALLVRIDQRHARNSLQQAEAELEVAKARLANVESERRRAEALFAKKSLSESDRDRAQLEVANAKAEVVRARVAVENARIEMDDTEIRAPIAGTIIARNVERGQVISSPVRDVGEGTLLLRMADLARVQVRTLVDETDIGRIQPGLLARVTVAAYPERPFEGEVRKLEPQAVTEQNVTMFPVLVGIDNPDGLLKPGMNCEVEIQIGRRSGVLAIPNAALRTLADVDSAARVLGLPQEEVRRQLREGAAVRRDGAEAPEGADEGEGPGRYVVFTLRDGRPTPVHVRTGLTDLDYSEVLSGLAESDSVLLLPSAGLVRSQEWRRSRIERVTGGGLPGLRSRR